MEACSGAGDVVYEPFCGSGASIIAGQRTGRHVRAMEIAPEYVDVALAQWATLFPGQAATLEDGRTFTDVAAERATSDRTT